MTDYRSPLAGVALMRVPRRRNRIDKVQSEASAAALRLPPGDTTDRDLLAVAGLRAFARRQPDPAAWFAEVAGALGLICPLDPATSEAEQEPDGKADRFSSALPREHGTPRGFRQHTTRGEDPCDDCRTAYNTDQNERRAQHRSARKASRT